MKIHIFLRRPYPKWISCETIERFHITKRNTTLTFEKPRCLFLWWKLEKRKEKFQYYHPFIKNYGVIFYYFFNQIVVYFLNFAVFGNVLAHYASIHQSKF